MLSKIKSPPEGSRLLRSDRIKICNALTVLCLAFDASIRREIFISKIGTQNEDSRIQCLHIVLRDFSRGYRGSTTNYKSYKSSTEIPSLHPFHLKTRRGFLDFFTFLVE